MNINRKLRLAAVSAVAAASLFTGVTLAGSSGAGAASSVITAAEAPQTPPNYIFPYMGFAYFSVANINQFQQMMYRPLYFFGLGSSVAYQPQLSLGSTPVWSNGNKTATITMKGWKFADGQTVNAQSVAFFLNMYKADPTSYAGYAPGYGIPDHLKSVKASGNTLTLNFDVTINPNWLLYNYLSEITPFPDAWDITGPGMTSTCATGTYGAAATNTACKAVEKYLAAQSAKVSTYTDAMWAAGTDGPWKLKSFDSLGNVSFVPNPSYSGPQKAQVSEVKLVPESSNQAELNQLLAGTLSLGYVDTTQLTSNAKSPTVAGPNLSSLSSKYNIVTGPSWSYNYDPINFNPKSDPAAAIFKQLYVRQALQASTDQQGIINKIDKGYGAPTYSPLPMNTPSSIGTGPASNPYPFSLSGVKASLKAHGWTLQGGVQTCTNPGSGSNQCGTGIAKGAKMNFTLLYVSGSQSITDVVNAEVSDWASIGIKVTTKTDTFNNVISGCSQSSKLTWEICTWGAGWIYAPDYYPSGEELLLTGAGSNAGGYSDPTMDTIIKATTAGGSTLTAYANYAAKQVPVLFQPTATGAGEVSKALKSSIGFQPNPLQNFMPEYLHF